MRRPLTVLLATDVFPPRCGGSGWSTYHLARALRARGHRVIVARPRTLPRGVASRVIPYDGLPVHECPLPDVRVPLARGVARQERFWPRFAAFLADLAHRERADLIHGQHLLSVPAAVAAARRAGVPAVATVRDYWPTCPTGTRLPRCPDAPRCSAACQVCCLARGRRALRPAVHALLPYVRANLARRQRALREASRVIAVSNHVATVLRDAIPGLAPVVLPNFIDLSAVDAAGDAAPEPRDGPMVLYAGKLDYHKGADLLPAAVAAVPGARLVVAGDGPLADAVARECAARGVALDLRDQVPNEEVLRLMRAADALLSPARWEEPLSRTLLEAGAAGLPAVALATGGTPDIVADGETGLLVADPAGLGPALAALLADPARRARLGAAARERIAAHFSEDAVVPRVEALYREVCEG
ncbi:MAG TPA: glycosyltransferase family 4 protein [Thermomicrobiales bacterium]|nr:glycosyltransferase family 4 protein [Thermomicrobiales bacterium]